jgi:hypothetical protein
MGVVSGDMFVDGLHRDNSFQRKTGYVQQQDLHLQTSTVREAFTFSARLRQPRTVPDEEKIAYVDEVIRLLNMEAYADAVVGVPGEGQFACGYHNIPSIMTVFATQVSMSSNESVLLSVLSSWQSPLCFYSLMSQLRDWIHKPRGLSVLCSENWPITDKPFSAPFINLLLCFSKSLIGAHLQFQLPIIFQC